MSVESSSQDRSLVAESLLRELDRTQASGVLEISHAGGDLSYVWVRQGELYAMQVPGYRPALGVRLLSGGLVCPEQLSEAAAEQRERLHPPRIGEVLVARGYVSAEVVAAFVHEQVLDQLADLLDLEVLRARFHPGRRIRQDVIAPTPVEELLVAAHEWRARRRDALRRVGGPRVVPHLRPPGQGSTQTPLGPDDWALLCRVDGRRDITELARVCGFTLQQAARIVADLALTAVLLLPEPAPAQELDLAPVVALRRAPEPDPQWEFAGTAAGEPEPLEAGPAQPELPAPESARTHAAWPRSERPESPRPESEWPESEWPESEWPEPSGNESAQLATTPPGTPQSPRPLLAEFGALLVDRPEGAPTTQAGTDPVSAGAPRPPALSVVPQVVEADPPPAPSAATAMPVAAEPAPTGEDTSVFMRELSSLSDDPDRDEPVVTRLVVPLTEERRRRRRWGR